MKVIIFEPEASGHRMILYVRHIVQEALRRGWDLHLVTTERVVDHPAYQVVKKECKDKLKISFMPRVQFPVENPTVLNLLNYQYRQYKAFELAYRSIAKENVPDVVYVVHLDYLFNVMSLLGSPFDNTPFAGMLMSVRHHHQRMGVIGSASRQDWLYEKLFYRLLRIPTLGSLCVIDESMYEYALKERFSSYDKLIYVPDVAHLQGTITREEARESLGVRNDQIVLLVYGSISERKGISFLFNILVADGCPKNVIVLLAGKQDQFTREFLLASVAMNLRTAGRLIEMPGFLDDTREYLSFRAADIVWVGYQGFYGMSGVLLQAGRMGLPVVACKEGLIGWITRRHEVGESINICDHVQALSTIIRLAKDSEAREFYGRRGFYLSQRHIPKLFGEGICNALESAYLGER
ncbi:MAG: hypothetical protein COC05_04070 [Gammaproteobacteria bacterium]|nr:glycosyltransferase family 4 protein [bacterium AH-315-E07]PCH60597.1 MAG: hypothetical protein COC05_04070 [Gammaproteobacteria bacterium]